MKLDAEMGQVMEVLSPPSRGAWIEICRKL